MRTQYKLSPAYNLPDTSQWFIECNKRDMQPYRCDTALRADFWEAFNCAVQEALDHNETSITIIWEYQPLPTNRRAYRQKAHSGSTKYAIGYIKEESDKTDEGFYSDSTYLCHMRIRHLEAPIQRVYLSLERGALDVPYVEVRYRHPRAVTGTFTHRLHTIQGINNLYRMAKHYGWKII